MADDLFGVEVVTPEQALLGRTGYLDCGSDLGRVSDGDGRSHAAGG